MTRLLPSFALLVATLTLGCAGCASLSVDVAAYKGSLINSADAQLGEAMGIAKDIYESWGDPRLAKQLDDDKTHPNDSDRLQTVLAVYRNEHLECTWAKYRESDPNQPAHAELQRRLALGLYRFAGACQSAGQGVGAPAAIEVVSDPRPVALIPSSKTKRIADGTAIEESGRRIMNLVDDAMDRSPRTSIARLMQSVTLGLVGSAAARALHAQSLVDDSYWGHINTIDVSGWGSTEYVLVKDEIGNWHLKTVVTNQGEVLSAIFDSVGMAVRVVGQAYGVPLPAAPASGTTTSPTAPAGGDAVAHAIDVERADQALQSLRDKKDTLRRALQSALAEKDATAQRTMVKEAVLMFQAVVTDPAKPAGGP
jgi:hypothetical protein